MIQTNMCVTFNSTNYIITTYQTNDNVILLSATDVALLYHCAGIQEAKRETTYEKLSQLGIDIQLIQHNKKHSAKYDVSGAFVFVRDAHNEAVMPNDVVYFNIKGVQDYISRCKDKGIIDRRAAFLKDIKVVMDCENIDVR